MQLAAFADEINRDDPARALQLAARWNIAAVEVRMLPGGRFPRVDDAELRDLGHMLGDSGRTVSGVSPGLFKCAVDDAEVEAELTQVLPRACEWARTWNTDRVSVFGFDRQHAAHGAGGFPASVVDRLGRMCDIAAAADCHLVLENEAVCWGDTGTEAANLTRAVGAERLSLCWDPGNAGRAGSPDPLAEYPDLADLVTHVHLKNFDPDTNAWSLMETGVVDWPTQLRQLAANAYGGYLVIETHTSAEPATAPMHDGGQPLTPLEANTLRNLQFTRALLD